MRFSSFSSYCIFFVPGPGPLLLLCPLVSSLQAVYPHAQGLLWGTIPSPTNLGNLVAEHIIISSLNCHQEAEGIEIVFVSSDRSAEDMTSYMKVNIQGGMSIKTTIQRSCNDDTHTLYTIKIRIMICTMMMKDGQEKQCNAVQTWGQQWQSCTKDKKQCTDNGRSLKSNTTGNSMMVTGWLTVIMNINGKSITMQRRNPVATGWLIMIDDNGDDATM